MKMSAEKKAELLDSILIEIDYSLRVYDGILISEEVNEWLENK